MDCWHSLHLRCTKTVHYTEIKIGRKREEWEEWFFISLQQAYRFSGLVFLFFCTIGWLIKSVRSRDEYTVQIRSCKKNKVNWHIVRALQIESLCIRIIYVRCRVFSPQMFLKVFFPMLNTIEWRLKIHLISFKIPFLILIVVQSRFTYADDYYLYQI